ncbi:MAG TPA: GIY-YIG nuclease family protein [Sphingobacteriaceae bacterium]
MGTGGWIYIMSNARKTTLYIGVTSNLFGSILQHKEHYYSGSFTHKYNLDICVYYEGFTSIEEAIAREKEVKKWRREKKATLINQLNPKWLDLWMEVKEW